jgi:hypothetical protein
MKIRKPTSAQIRDHQKTKELKRIADALENLVYLADGAVKTLTTACIAGYKMLSDEKARQTSEKVQ